MFMVLAQQGLLRTVVLVLILVTFCVYLSLLMFFFTYGFLWMKALLAGAHVGILEILAMRFRGVRPSVIVESRIMATKAGLPIQTVQLETHYLAQGNVPNVVRALIAASRAGIPLTFDEACAIDLAGRDVLAEVQRRMQPKVQDWLEKISEDSTQ